MIAEMIASRAMALFASRSLLLPAMGHGEHTLAMGEAVFHHGITAKVGTNERVYLPGFVSKWGMEMATAMLRNERAYMEEFRLDPCSLQGVPMKQWEQPGTFVAGEVAACILSSCYRYVRINGQSVHGYMEGSFDTPDGYDARVPVLRETHDTDFPHRLASTDLFFIPASQRRMTVLVTDVRDIEGRATESYKVNIDLIIDRGTT